METLDCFTEATKDQDAKRWWLMHHPVQKRLAGRLVPLEGAGTLLSGDFFVRLAFAASVSLVRVISMMGS